MDKTMSTIMLGSTRKCSSFEIRDYSQASSAWSDLSGVFSGSKNDHIKDHLGVAFQT